MRLVILESSEGSWNHAGRVWSEGESLVAGDANGVRVAGGAVVLAAVAGSDV